MAEKFRIVFMLMKDGHDYDYFSKGVDFDSESNALKWFAKLKEMMGGE